MLNDVYVANWSLYNMYKLNPVQFGILGVESRALNELAWPKRINCFLQQCDGLPVMHMGLLTVVSRVMGRPSWSLGDISSTSRHRGDEL